MGRSFMPTVDYVASVNGKPKAVIMSIEDWERISGTLKILSNKEFAVSLARARRQLKDKVKLLSHQEVFGDL